MFRSLLFIPPFISRLPHSFTHRSHRSIHSSNHHPFFLPPTNSPFIHHASIDPSIHTTIHPASKHLSPHLFFHSFIHSPFFIGTSLSNAHSVFHSSFSMLMPSLRIESLTQSTYSLCGAQLSQWNFTYTFIAKFLSILVP